MTADLSIEPRPRAPLPALPTITIPSGCKPWKAASRDQSRPALCHGYLRERDGAWWLLTTDSYIAAAIKVEITGDVQEGWVPREVLKAAARARVLASFPVQVGIAAWKIRTDDGHATIEIAPPAKDFPDLAALGMWEAKPGEPLTAIGLDPRLTVQLSKALGFALGLGGLKLEFTGHSGKGSDVSPMRVTGGVHYPERIGLQMPVRLDV